MREGKLAGRPRTQTQLALNAAPGRWTLLEASPDLRAQIEGTKELWPQDSRRDSPVSDVVLTGAEVDQTLGLLLLREFHSFRVHSTRSIHTILTEDNSLFGVLSRFADQVTWNDILLDHPFSAGSARFEVLSLPGAFPGFVSASRLAKSDSAEAVIGLWVTPQTGGGALAFLPGVASLPDALLERLKTCAVLLFDGTFWSDDEPLRFTGAGRTARQMGHLPISGPCGSLEQLAALAQPRKIFIHINNTNPLLDEESEEFRTARGAGWEVAWDGMELML